MLDWDRDENGRYSIGRVVLADLDWARHLSSAEELIDGRAGHDMWRSPEGQVGEGIGLPSEIFSFGLLVSERACFTNKDSG